MTDDRSERLRKRRNRSIENVKGHRQTTTESDTGEPTVDNQGSSNESNAGTESSVGDSVSIKDEQVGTYMYLPEFQTKELRRLYNVLKAEYEFKYDDEFEKNRHFYPLVVQYGLDGLDGLDTSEIRSQLEQLYE